MTDLQTVTIGLDDDVRSRIERLAADRREPIDVMMREALLQFVEREENRARFHLDAMASWADYQETGLHATSDEVDAWLQKLEAGEAVAPPRCHD